MKADPEVLPKSDFRQGRRVARNVYHGDEPLFMAATDELAAELVLILNAGATALRGGVAEAEQMRERAATCAETPDAWAYQWEGQPTYFAIGAAIRDLSLAQPDPSQEPGTGGERS